MVRISLRSHTSQWSETRGAKFGSWQTQCLAKLCDFRVCIASSRTFGIQVRAATKVWLYIYIYYIEVSTIVFTTDPSSQRYQWFPTSLVVKVCGWKLILTCIKARCKQPAICWWQIPAVQVWPLRYQAPGSYVSCDYCNRHLAQTWKARSCVINTVYGLQLRYV